jgi:flagellar M-ring protein FliF
MENALTPQPAGGAPIGATPNRLSDPVAQARAMLSQPAVKRALPAILLVALLGVAAIAWMALSTPPQRVLFANMTDGDKAAVTQALGAAGIANRIDGSGSLTVGEDDYHKARMLLASQDLPKAAPGGYALLDQLPMGVSRAVEGERLRQARETELARSISEIDAVADARVHLATPESSVFVRDSAAPSASVIVRLEAGRALSDAQVRSIVNLVASSVPGMKPDAVTIVDQMGALLNKSGPGGQGESATDERIAFQQRIETKYREQLAKLLTPLVGVGNFSAEVQAEVNLDETQATRETIDPNSVVRAEQGSWASASNNQAPGGIPGALANTVPAPTEIVAPEEAPAVDPNADPALAGVAPAALPKASEEFSRAYDVGKEISVTRAMPGEIRRLSVAVLLRETEGARPRTKAEIDQINQLVRSAVGFNQARQDQVTVISRPFSPDAVGGTEPSWYEASWVPMVARNATALIIALLVLLLGVRPLAKALMKKREDAGSRPALGRDNVAALGGGQAALGEDGQPQRPGVSIDMLENARSYDERVGLVKGFTRDNPTRAALAVRDMIQAENKQ